MGNVLPRIKEVCIPNLDANRKHYEDLSIEEESELNMACGGSALTPTEETSEADSRPSSITHDHDAEVDYTDELPDRMDHAGGVREASESARSL